MGLYFHRELSLSLYKDLVEQLVLTTVQLVRIIVAVRVVVASHGGCYTLLIPVTTEAFRFSAAKIK